MTRSATTPKPGAGPLHEPGDASFERALEAWREALGPDRVVVDPDVIAGASRNLSALDRRVPAILRPTTVDEVVAVVAAANAHRAPIYPISTGKNWGLGSALPPRDGVAIVDLGGMNRIRSVDAAHGYAIIEPGVTQGQLLAHLAEHAPGVFFDPTGAPTHTSIVGNVLDRGVGYFACRFESLLGMEIVLGNGRLVRTGFWHMDGARTAHLLQYGVGPYLDGLFTQSNFGVVTAISFKLLPRPEAFSAMWCRLPKEDGLPALVDALAGLRRRGVLRTVVHLADAPRTEGTLRPLLREEMARDGDGDQPPPLAAAVAPWSAVSGIYGTAAQVRVAERAIKRAMRGVTPVRFITERKLAIASKILKSLSFIKFFKRQLQLVRTVGPLTGLARGVPTDAAIKSVYLPSEPSHDASANPDHSHAGILYCLPIIPLDGASVTEGVGIARAVCAEHDLPCYITLNTMNDHCLEGVINVAFDRRDAEQTERAHRCVDAMLERFIAAGFPPYRIGIQHMARVADPDDPFWQTAADLKRALDPNHVIAPGRYNLV